MITSFAVANAISLPLTGWLTVRYGQVRLFVASTLLFVIASFLCALAPTLAWLIGFRVIQDRWPKPSLRELLEIDLKDGDVSVVAYPAYASTSAEARPTSASSSRAPWSSRVSCRSADSRSATTWRMRRMRWMRRR